MKYTNKKEQAKKILVYILAILVVVSVAFVFFSPIFEKNAPKISMGDEIYWNLQTPLKIEISDDTQIKSFEIVYKDEQHEQVAQTKILSESKGVIELEVLAPKFDMTYQAKNATLNITVRDTSKWNFFLGNELQKSVKLKIDKVKPVANVLSNSYGIAPGGCAAVVVEVKDENIKEAYISFNGVEKFELLPFYKNNFYMAIITWPIYISEFKRVDLVAVDYAGNKTETKVPLYLKNFKIKNDELKITDDFIERVSKNVLMESSIDVPSNPEEIFLKTNNALRAQNVQKIKDISRSNMSREMVTKFQIDEFKRLPASTTFAGFGERRTYMYNGNKIDEAWHLGSDWASVKKAKIFTSNKGKVILNEYLGIYGNTLIIDHGFGLGSLYGHTTNSMVNLNDEVKGGDYIANTGSTGAVFGDHLHFGVLVQGIEVNPLEWLSRHWIKENIESIIENSKKVIDAK